MKIYLITPVDLKYSYKATEGYVYKYAEYLEERGCDVELLITQMGGEHSKELPDYKEITKPYKKIKQRPIKCSKYLLPFKWHIFVYKSLPNDGMVYFPYSIYDYLFNILFKQKGQKYIIGCHSMHLKKGNIIENHKIMEWLLNFLVKNILFIRKKEKANIYFHAINSEQINYLTKNFGIDKRNMFYVPNFIDAGDYKLIDNNSKKLRIIHIGGIEKDSNIVFDLIRLLNENKIMDKVEFYFIGGLNQITKNQYGTYKNVYILGQIGNTEKSGLLKNMDCMIIPSYEAFPKTVLEGLLSGLYILTSKKNAAWRDFANLGIKMFVAENGFPEEYLQPVINLAEKKNKDKNINSYKESNRKKVVKNFDEENVLPKIFRMFKKVENESCFD